MLSRHSYTNALSNVITQYHVSRDTISTSIERVGAKALRECTGLTELLP